MEADLTAAFDANRRHLCWPTGCWARSLRPKTPARFRRGAAGAASANRDRGAPPLALEVRQDRAVAANLVGRAAGARLALIDGAPGAVWAPGGRPRALFAFRVAGDTISEIEIVIDPASVAALPIAPV